MNVVTRPAPEGISAEEWEVRCDLAALYRLVAHHRMTDLIYTHISARLPGPEHHFLINPYGVQFHEMRASDLVRIDLDGRVVAQGSPHGASGQGTSGQGTSGRFVNAAGFTIHSAIHMARPDLMCVIHTHTAAGIAVSAQEQGLLPISQHAMKFYGQVSYHGYEGIALDLDERDRLVRDLGPDNKVMILRNHGLLATGRSIPEAWGEIYFLERACQAQIAALAGGCKLVMPPEDVRRHTAEQAKRVAAPEHCDMLWQSCLRLIEEGRPDYRS